MPEKGQNEESTGVGVKKNEWKFTSKKLHVDRTQTQRTTAKQKRSGVRKSQ